MFNDSESATTINMILDHNTTAEIVWNDKNVNVAYSESNIAPEINKLVTESNWKSVPRLITAEEVNLITGKTDWKKDGTWYCLESKKHDVEAVPWCNNTGTYGWLYDYTYCKEDSYDWKCSNNDTATYGYWVSTTHGTAGSGSTVWLVSRRGVLNRYIASIRDYGVRPVITISKAKLS